MGFDSVRRIGVVLLTNAARDADDIALHLLNRALPLAACPIARTAIDVPADRLARYVGEYQYFREFRVPVTLSVTLENGVLTIQATGGDKAPIFAESETKFFARATGTQFTFLTDEAGLATGLILHQSRYSRTVKNMH